MQYSIIWAHEIHQLKSIFCFNMLYLAFVSQSLSWRSQILNAYIKLRGGLMGTRSIITNVKCLHTMRTAFWRKYTKLRNIILTTIQVPGAYVQYKYIHIPKSVKSSDTVQRVVVVEFSVNQLLPVYDYQYANLYLYPYVESMEWVSCMRRRPSDRLRAR